MEQDKPFMLWKGSKPWTPDEIRKFNFCHKTVLFSPCRLEEYIHPLSFSCNENTAFLGGNSDLNWAVNAGVCYRGGCLSVFGNRISVAVWGLIIAHVTGLEPRNETGLFQYASIFS